MEGAMVGFIVGNRVVDLYGPVECFNVDGRVDDLDSAMISFAGEEVGTWFVVRVGLPVGAADGAEV